MTMGAFDSALCLKTSFLTRLKCVSNMSAGYFSSVVFMDCLCFNHLVSTLIPSEKGEAAAEICAVYITASHPTVRSQHRAPGAAFGSSHQHVRGDQTEPLHSQGPHFFLSWQLTQISESTNMRRITLSRLSVGGAIKALGSATTVHHHVPVSFNHCFHNIAGARHRKLCERSNSVERTLKPTLTLVRVN